MTASVLGVVVSGGVGAAGAAALSAWWSSDPVSVVRVVDGNTVVVDRGGESVDVRLLNVDTPETKHPDKPVECLGPEATAFLKRHLPVGAAVELQYDRERQDRYGRDPAGVSPWCSR